MLRLVNQLPSGSAYWAARADDDELAELALESAGDEGSPGGVSPPLAEMTRQVQVLMDLADGLSGITARLDALLGETGRAHPYPRPDTAMSRARKRAIAAQRSDLLGEVIAAQERWTDG